MSTEIFHLQSELDRLTEDCRVLAEAVQFIAAMTTNRLTDSDSCINDAARDALERVSK